MYSKPGCLKSRNIFNLKWCLELLCSTNSVVEQLYLKFTKFLNDLAYRVTSTLKIIDSNMKCLLYPSNLTPSVIPSFNCALQSSWYIVKLFMGQFSHDTVAFITPHLSYPCCLLALLHGEPHCRTTRRVKKMGGEGASLPRCLTSLVSHGNGKERKRRYTTARQAP